MSFESHNADEASTRTTHAIIKSGDQKFSVSSGECQDIYAAQSPHPDKPGDGGYTNKFDTWGHQLVAYQGNDTSLASRATVDSRGAAVIKSSSGYFASPDPINTSRKRIFDEIEEPALPSSQTSGIRLSMTVDGAVKVKTTDEETPSPPKQPPQNLASLQKAGLRRSYSATAATELLKDGPMNRARSTSGIFGRSRDARTWEFYCDGDARVALSAQADNEITGSAVGAINLIRSQGQNAKSKAQQRGKGRALKPKLGAGNAKKEADLSEQKPRLMRAMSSMACLPSDSKYEIAEINMSKKRSRLRSPSGESDKENWAPGTRSSGNSLRRTEPSSSASRDVLQDHLLATRPKTACIKQCYPRSKQSGPGQENNPPENDLFQLHGLTDGERKEEDLDCIQGLLSLSQGAWN